jgi:hypothetical protein
MKSSFDGDFYATFGLLHGCVIAQRGTKAWSPNMHLSQAALPTKRLCPPRMAKFTRTGNSEKRLGDW